jgi:hypothetical protein
MEHVDIEEVWTALALLEHDDERKNVICMHIRGTSF